MQNLISSRCSQLAFIIIFFAMQWTEFSLWLKDSSVSDSLRSCLLSLDIRLRTELGLMDGTEVWERVSLLISWGRDQTEISQGKGTHSTDESLAFHSQPHGWPTLGHWANFSGSLWVSDLLYERKRSTVKRKLRSTKVLLYLESLQHSLNLTNTTILGSLYIYSTNEKGETTGTALVSPLLRLHAPNAGGLGSNLGKGTRSHIPQQKTLCAATKARSSQINKQLKKKDRLCSQWLHLIAMK